MTSTTATLLERFIQQAERTDAHVVQFGGWDEVAALALELSAGGRIALSPNMAEREQLLEMLGAVAFVPPVEGAVAATADTAVGIVRGRVAVAETGSVLLVEETQAERAVSMLTRTLIEVVTEADLVPDLFAVREYIIPPAGASPRYAALVTGPSRTGDIERVLTIGVQGPATAYVVVLP